MNKRNSRGGGVHLKPLTDGFTLAEVLITLAIIGVVAAMTIPTLTKNIQEREYLTAAKRINSMISNSIAFVEANDGIQSASDPEDFVRNYLSQYLKISKTCGYENHEACGFITKTNGIHRIDDVKMTLPTIMEELQTSLLSYTPDSGDAYNTSQTLASVDRRGYSFLTSNGYSMMLFYNPNCLSDDISRSYYMQDRVCVNILWDMNGHSSPNQVGKDIGFTTVLYPKYSSIVTPVAYTTSTKAKFDDTNATCLSHAGVHYKVPNRDELASMYYNGTLINQTDGYFWSSDPISAEWGWGQSFNIGTRNYNLRSIAYDLRCIRR